MALLERAEGPQHDGHNWRHDVQGHKAPAQGPERGHDSLHGVWSRRLAGSDPARRDFQPEGLSKYAPETYFAESHGSGIAPCDRLACQHPRRSRRPTV